MRKSYKDKFGITPVSYVVEYLNKIKNMSGFICMQCDTNFKEKPKKCPMCKCPEIFTILEAYDFWKKRKEELSDEKKER